MNQTKIAILAVTHLAAFGLGTQVARRDLWRSLAACTVRTASWLSDKAKCVAESVQEDMEDAENEHREATNEATSEQTPEASNGGGEPA